MIDPSFLNELERFSLILRKRVTSKYSGERKSIAFGKGLVFKEFRKYEPGDDFRGIDWKVFGRTDKYFIRRMEEERNLQLHVILDVSKSMDYGKPTKMEYAAKLGAGFAYLATKDNEKFQFATFANSIEIFKPQRGKTHLGMMIDHFNNLKPKGVSKLGDALAIYAKTVKTRSFFVIISDYLVDVSEIQESLSRLRHHEVKVIQVLTPQERNLNIEGEVNLKDMESGGIMNTFITNRARTKYQNKLEEHISEINKICEQLQMDFFSVNTSQPVFDVFFEVMNA